MIFFREDGLLLKREGALLGAKASVRIVVSKKVAKQAVRRNRIRRVLREAFRKESAAAPPVEGGLVLIVLPGFEASNTAEAQDILRRLFHKACM